MIVKRMLDMIASFSGLFLLSPLFLIVAVMIKIDSRGPVFFTQERIGKGFRHFWIYKFRSMVRDAPLTGGLLTSGGDPRITRVGRFLRQMKIDELPQLINVLRGDMSLVGPRPEVRRYVELFRERYLTILTVRPGITDLASLKYRDESAILARSTNPEDLYVQCILPDKLVLAEEYVRRSSLGFDLVVIWKTLVAVALRKHPGHAGDLETSSVIYRKTAGMRPRLLFLIDEDRDFCTHRLDLARAAREAGFEVLVATHVQRHAKRIEQEGFKLIPITLRRGVQSPHHDWSALIELIHLYRVLKPDIVHHVALKQVLFGAIAARIAKVPAVVNAVTGLGYMFQPGSPRRALLRWMITPVLRWALSNRRSVTIFQNKDDLEDFVRSGLVDMSRAVIIRGAGVNVAQFRPSPELDGIPVVMLASRLLRDKGVKEFVTAARLLKSNDIHARCVLVGTVDHDNPSSVSVAQVRGWSNEGVIEWWGHYDEMSDVFAFCHVVVLPSYAEGLPKVLLEAAACAKPLIATRIRGCQEVVRDGDNGLLVPVREARALAQAIMTLVQNKALREHMGARGRDIAVNEFRVQLIANETLSVYGRLLRNGSTLVDQDASNAHHGRKHADEVSYKSADMCPANEANRRLQDPSVI